ncbi:hypothetical protein [Bifidobacterium breve]|uniref:hypothetical protein n=1 Tax=Bifidobacterium breve TaxID=1685 RepID=UPI000CA314D3|nr:hypothetical protein [Bifidobacterium breve]AUD87238.1 hypothetical protein NRBB57_1235 [Bifidobacterium breve]
MVLDAHGRSHRAKGLPKGYAGTFDTTAAGTGGDDVAPPVGGDGPRPEHAIMDAGQRILTDPDVMEYAQYAAVRLDAMIGRTAGPGETDDLPLIVENLRYDPRGADGSRADYLAEHVEEAFAGTPVRARDRKTLMEETRRHILATAMRPDEVLARLGLPPVRPGERVGDDDRPENPCEKAERRYRAAVKGARTRRLRHDVALENHLAPLDDDMRALYKANVDRGLQSGSAFDDRIAFADALAELQADGWDPAAGREYRGVGDAIRLARWDPDVEYTVADAKSHTFRMEHDKPGIGYYSDGSTYPIGHAVITANGSKPASVMSWIHREKPGTPEWERRARARFEEANGGEWTAAAETD